MLLNHQMTMGLTVQETGCWIFPVAILSVLLIAVLTVGFQAYRASQSNPVDAISYE